MTPPPSDAATRRGSGPGQRGSVPAALIAAGVLAVGALAVLAIVVARSTTDTQLEGAVPTAIGAAPSVVGGVPPNVEVPSSGAIDTQLDLSSSLTNGPIALGAPGTITISAQNTGSRPMSLVRLNILAVDSSDPGCSPEWFRVGAATVPDEKVAPGDAVLVRFPYELVDLPDVNQDACKGASFRLTIRGSGRFE